MAVRFVFDMTNPGQTLDTRGRNAHHRLCVQEQIETARRVIVDGYNEGRGPQDITTDIAGRVDRVTGKRTGGIVGLSNRRRGYVSPRNVWKAAIRQNAQSAGRRTLRDKRFDGRILKAIGREARREN